MATLTELNVSQTLCPLECQTQNKRTWPYCRAVEIRVKNIESFIVEGYNFIQENIHTYTEKTTKYSYSYYQRLAGLESSVAEL